MRLPRFLKNPHRKAQLKKYKDTDSPYSSKNKTHSRRSLFKKSRLVSRRGLLLLIAALILCVYFFCTLLWPPIITFLKHKYLDYDFKLADIDIGSSIDAPFYYGCNDIKEYLSDPEYQKQNAAFVMLTQNSELEDVLKTMESLELKFNQWFQYPYVFLNDEPFTQEFKDAVQQHTLSKVEFGVIPSDNWDFPEHLESKTSDQKSSKNVQFESNFEDQEDRGILYGGMKSYHKMCRFYSGFFYKHPLVQQYEWYWRIEPDVRFFCTTTYDPFYEMQKHKKRYGFTILIDEIYWTIPSLFKHTQAFLKNYKKNVDSSFEVGTLWPMFVDSSKQYDGDADEKFGDTKVLDIFVNRQEEVDEELSRYVEKEYYLKNYEPDASQVQERIKEHGIGSIIRQGFIKPEIFEDKFDKQEYNLCHFWSNFEISRVDTFDNPIYNAYFQYLDNLGGFYQERWGDAVVHTLGVAMLNREDIHYFRDMGYQHSTLAHCPKNLANGQLDNPNDKNFESTCLPFYKTYGQHTSKNTANSWKTRIQDTLSTVFLQEEPSATAYGSGCQCECPFLKDDIEDASSFCSSKFFEHMSDDYRPERKPKLNSLMNKVYQSYERYIQE